jgi:hypothetical protein
MDVLSLLVAGLLIKGSEGFATEAGRATWASVSQAVGAKFRDDPPAQAALARAEVGPPEEGAARNLAEHLRRHMDDEDFREAMQSLIDEGRRNPDTDQEITPLAASAERGWVFLP